MKKFEVSYTLPYRHDVTVGISANSAEGYIACALAGLGLIQIPAYDVADHLARGALVEVMPDHRPDAMPMHLLFPGPSRHMRRLTAFADWIETVLRQAIPPDAGPPDPA
jgi:DNA-binding transcriptional LysR family regulator